MKYNYQGWQGCMVDAYFGNLEKGEWIDITLLKYLWLKVKGCIVRKNKRSL